MFVRQFSRQFFLCCGNYQLQQKHCQSLLERSSEIKFFLQAISVRRHISFQPKKPETGNMANNMASTSVPSKKPTQMEPLIRLNNIEKSQQDTREYRGLQLENGMKVLLISDPKTDLSAAALAVQVGHMSDPDDLPGLAHFCEHMLFLGTEKYPQENGYTDYLTQSGGGSNATTFPLMTKYYFHVAPDKLDGALDRFAQFFIAPLFTPSATEREINAVNSEHEKNLVSDIWRKRQVIKHLAKKDHAFSKFGSGNKATLYDIPKSKNIDVRDELLKFHKKWYSANIMSLAVIGKESLNELEAMVLPKFSEIENKNVEIPSWPSEPFDADKYGSKLKIVPVKDLRSLSLSFTTKDLTHYYKSSPEGYLAHLIGHEGKGSILSELRRLGWCNGLSTDHESTLNGFGFFQIRVNLTQEGFEHIDDIIAIIFQYIRLLREKGLQKWIFDECLNINEMRFRFKEKERPESFVNGAVSAMQIYPLEEVLTAPYLNFDWRPDLITELLGTLVPEKCRVTIVSQCYENEANETEPYYKAKYCLQKIPNQTINQWKNCKLNKNLALPLPNAFIPTNFEVYRIDPDCAKHPTIIMDSPILRVWHKQDDEFLKPKACMSFELSNPMAYSDPLNSSLNQMMVSLFKDQLNEYLYDADLAGLLFDVSAKSAGIEFSIKGYSEKQLVLLEKILEHLFDFKIDEKRFDILKEEYTRTLKNLRADQPYQHAIYYLAVILTENAWASNEQLDAMELVTYDRVVNYTKEFFERLHVEAFIYGNVPKQKAIEIAVHVNSRLEKTNSTILPLLARQMLKKREYKLARRDSYLFEKENEFHSSSCAHVYFQCGPATDKSNTMVALLSQILSEPCHDVLRTKEQLGYIVFSGMRKINGANGMRIIVQSHKHPSFVEDRIENFLENYLKVVEEMPLDEFERHKESLATMKLEKPKNIYEQFRTLYNEIQLVQYHFERAEAEVAILRKITKEEFIKFFKAYISKDGEERKVLSIHIVSSKFLQSDVDMEKEITNMDRHVKINDVVTFKASKELYPLGLPYIDISAKGARSKL